MDLIGVQGVRKIRCDAGVLEQGGLFEELRGMLTLSGRGNFEPIHRLSELPCGQDRPGNGSWLLATLALRPFLGEEH